MMNERRYFSAFCCFFFFLSLVLNFGLLVFFFLPLSCPLAIGFSLWVVIQKYKLEMIATIQFVNHKVIILVQFALK